MTMKGSSKPRLCIILLFVCSNVRAVLKNRMFSSTRAVVGSYYGPKRALNRQVLILCTKRSRSVSDITSMQSVVRNQYRLVLRKWNDEMVSEIPSHSTVNMHF